MALLGTAALAMWWDMALAMRAEFEDWHSHEHFPERLAIPGFRRASRWLDANGGAGVFVMYELESYEVLSSPSYLARLNAPTPWSARLMPHHRQMVRSQCRVLDSAGGGVARHALTVRLSPLPGRDEALRGHLKDVAVKVAPRPGCVGGHLLKHETPPIARTTEQQIRGNDANADWVFVAVGYEAGMLQAIPGLTDEALLQAGSEHGIVRGLYSLSFSATAGEPP